MVQRIHEAGRGLPGLHGTVGEVPIVRKSMSREDRLKLELAATEGNFEFESMCEKLGYEPGRVKLLFASQGLRIATVRPWSSVELSIRPGDMTLSGLAIHLNASRKTLRRFLISQRFSARRRYGHRLIFDAEQIKQVEKMWAAEVATVNRTRLAHELRISPFLITKYARELGFPPPLSFEPIFYTLEQATQLREHVDRVNRAPPVWGRSNDGRVWERCAGCGGREFGSRMGEYLGHGLCRRCYVRVAERVKLGKIERPTTTEAWHEAADKILTYDYPCPCGRVTVTLRKVTHKQNRYTPFYICRSCMFRARKYLRDHLHTTPSNLPPEMVVDLVRWRASQGLRLTPSQILSKLQELLEQHAFQLASK